MIFAAIYLSHSYFLSYMIDIYTYLILSTCFSRHSLYSTEPPIIKELSIVSSSLTYLNTSSSEEERLMKKKPKDTLGIGSKCTNEEGDEPFIRTWNYYLKYCEAGFATRNISVVQAVYTRPNNLKL